MPQDFLQRAVLGRASPEVEEGPPQPPVVVPPKPVLMPCPSPIMSPWPASPLPSIPSLPSPGEAVRASSGGVTGGQSGWTFRVNLEQLRSLFANVSEEQGSPVECFMGSLNLLYHFIRQATQDRLQMPQQVSQACAVREDFILTRHVKTEVLHMSGDYSGYS